MSRERRYLIAMGFRVACVIAMLFVGGWARWLLLAAAAVLPAIAVLIANAVDRRGELTLPVHAEETEQRAITGDLVHLIPGEVEEDSSARGTQEGPVDDSGDRREPPER